MSNRNKLLIVVSVLVVGFILILVILATWLLIHNTEECVCLPKRSKRNKIDPLLENTNIEEFSPFIKIPNQYTFTHRS